MRAICSQTGDLRAHQLCSAKNAQIVLEIVVAVMQHLQEGQEAHAAATTCG